MSRLTRLAVLLPLAALGCRSAPAPVRSAAPGAPAKPSPVVVTIVIDQFAAWIAADRLALLPEDGGFARLRREGTWALDMRYGHPITETSPGHAALYTGVVPRQNGIYSNDLPGPGDEALAIVQDPTTRLVAASGPTDRAGASLHRLRAETLADELRRERPGAAIVGLSLKDRGALYGGGRHPDATLWFDHTHDVFVTSTAIAGTYPAWARALTEPAAIAARRAIEWRPLDPAFLAAHAAAGDDAPGEGNYSGLGTTFPHDFARAAKPGPALRSSPETDSLLLDLALAAIDARRPAGEPMLVAVSLSAHDYVGHIFGPDSWEEWDELARLDAALARFFRGLDERLGEDGWSVLLTADHGSCPMPELPLTARPWCAPGANDRWQRPCAGGGRIDKKRLAAELRAAARDAAGEGRWVAGVEDPFVFLTPEARALEPARRAALRSALTRVLATTAGVERVMDLEAMDSETCPAGESIEALVCNVALVEDGASLYAVLAPGWMFYTSMTPGQGGNHGAPYLYDRAVPLLVRAPGRVAAGAVVEEPISFSSFSRTAAALLGIRAPAGEAGVDLTRR